LFQEEVAWLEEHRFPINNSIDLYSDLKKKKKKKKKAYHDFKLISANSAV
jgi:hypothetical protein